MLVRSLVAFVAATLLLPSIARADVTFSPGASMANARAQHIQVKLADGRVLVAAGVDSALVGAATNTAEIYDPVAGTWSAAGVLTDARSAAMAVRLADGRVLVTGGTASPDPASALKSTEIYDPATNTWSPTGPMTTGRSQAAIGLLPDGKVIVAGGVDTNLTTEIYDPAAGTWSAGDDLAADHVVALGTTLADGDLLITGDASPPERYDAATGQWGAAGTLPVATPAVYSTLTALADGRVLQASGGFGDQAAIYTPSSNTWSAAAPMPAPAIGATATRLADGDVMFAGGLSASLSDSPASRYHPDSDTWTDAGGTSSRALHRATLLDNGKLMLVGGANLFGFTGGGVLKTTELYPGTTGVAGPAITFGSLPVGQASATYLIPVRGTTVTTARLTGATVSGPAAGDFTINPSDCVDRPLTKDGGACFMAAVFTPSAAGPRSAVVDLAGNFPAAGIALSGVGAAPGAVGPRGPRGKLGKVQCKLKKVKKSKKNKLGVKIKCKVKGAKGKSAHLVSNGRTVAHGTARRLVGGQALEPGRYTLRIGRSHIAVRLR